MAQSCQPAAVRLGRLLRRVHVPRVLLLVQGTAPAEGATDAQGLRSLRGASRTPTEGVKCRVYTTLSS